MILGILLALAGVAALSHIAPFPFILDTTSGHIAVWRMPKTPGTKTVYLTFDDGPNPAATPMLLDLLKEKRAHATFFIIAEHVNEGTAPIVRRMFEEGHVVGLHSADRWLMLRSPKALERVLRNAADRVEAYVGRRPCPLFRPHAGWRSIPMFRGLSRAGYGLVGWSWMSWDWNWFRKRTGTRVASQLLSHAAPGNIIVIHDGHHRSLLADRSYAIEATRLVIEGLSARGYDFGALRFPSPQ